MKQILAGHALSEGHAAVAIGELTDENPFSTLLIYNEGGRLTWGHVDVRRTLVSIASCRGNTSQAEIFVAMSNEGDVYFAEGSAPREKIPGAGTLSDDAMGLGSMTRLRNLGGRLYACGHGAQIYVRNAPKDWSRLADKNVAGLGNLRFLGLDMQSGNSSLVVCGYTDLVPRTVTAAQEAEIQSARQRGDLATYRRMLRESRIPEARPKGCLYFQTPKGWVAAELPNRQYLRDVLSLPDGRVVAVGSGGVIVAGRLPDELEDASDPGLMETLSVVATRKSEVLVLGDSAIHSFSRDFSYAGSLATPGEIGEPISLSLCGPDALWCFGRKGMARHRDDRWDVVAIPPEYWRRGP